MNKYVAFRFEDQIFRDGRLVDGCYVQGQKASDLNWTTLGEFESWDAAKEFIKSQRTDPLHQPVYDLHGYSLKFRELTPWQQQLVALYMRTGEPVGRIEGTGYRYYLSDEGDILVMWAGNSDTWMFTNEI